MSWKSLTSIDILYTKMTLWPKQTFWWCSWTSIASDADTRHAKVFLATLLTLRDTWKILLNTLKSVPTIFTYFTNLLKYVIDEHFLPPEGEVLVRGVGLWCRLFWNELENADFYRHIIYQNDPMVKPDLMVMVPDLYRRRHRRQACRRLPRHHPVPQKHLQCFINCTKNLLNMPIY